MIEKHVRKIMPSGSHLFLINYKISNHLDEYLNKVLIK